MRSHTAVVAIVSALLGAAQSGAATFTVGPHGTYATIQAAVDAAVAAGGDSSILVERGTYAEHDVGNDTPEALGSLRLLGGWDATFTAREARPTETVLDAGGLGPALRFACTAGRLTIEGLTITGGRAGEVLALGLVMGGGALLDVRGTCAVSLRALHVVENEAMGCATQGSAGGGIAADMRDEAELILEDLRVERNRAACESGDARGGGVWVSGGVIAGEPARWRARVERTVVAENTASGSGVVFSGAELTGGRVEVFDSTFRDNGASPFGTALEVAARSVEVRRIQLLANDCGDGGEQLGFLILEEGAITDSLVADGTSCGGVGGLVLEGAVGFLTNLTVAGNAGDALRPFVQPKGSLTLANSLVFGNGFDGVFDPGLTVAASNLIGVDPLFANPAAGDYRPLAGSPAIDAGDDLPDGGRGPFDLDGRDRILGRQIDLGAYEATSGLCDVRGHGTLPVPDFAPACICVRDLGLRAFRCGFFLSDVFVNLAIPLSVKPGELTELDLTIDPWQGSQGPYEVALEMLQKGQWVPLDGDAGKLKEGHLERLSFELIAPASTTPIRARLLHRSPGTDKPVEDAMGAALVVDGPKGN